MKAKWTLLGSLLAVLLLALAMGPGQAQGPQPPGEGVQPQGEVGIAAAVYNRIPIQGRQTDASGNPPNGTFNNVPLGIYATESGGTALESTSITPTVYSQGQVTIRGTWSCDLDLGNETYHTDPSRDFFWEQVTSVERYITPKNGAKFHVIGIVDFNSIEYSDLKGYSYSTDRINGSNDASNQIPQGTVVAAVTNEGRYCKFRIDTYGYNLTITWLTYNKEYGIYLPLVLRNYP